MTQPSIVTPLDGHKYAEAGICIYCGSTEKLEKEHILPLGLSGTAILPKSSCRACAKITGEFEQKILRGSFWPLRVFRDLKSRTKHADAPNVYPVTLLQDKTEKSVDLSIDQLPILLHFPIFGIPRVLANSFVGQGVEVKGIATVVFGKTPEQVSQELGVTGIRMQQLERPALFARMLAKVGYAYAWAEGAIRDIEVPSPLIPAILGITDNIGDWVGTLDKPYEAHPGVLHRLQLAYDREKGLLFVEIQLFADSQTPSYGIVLGRLKNKA